MNILWAITGAGHLLDESIGVLEKLAENNTLTIATSNAACEVLKLYGYDKNIRQLVDKNSANMLVLDSDEKYSFPFSGKLTHYKYDVIIIAPLTANTTAKIVYGIADTLITNIAAQSGKGQIPLIVLPVDQKQGLIKTIIPPYIDKKRCINCKNCIPKDECPQNAINPPKIDTTKCISCFMCEDKCKYDAIKLNEEIELYIRKIDAENTKKLETIENIKVVLKPSEILKEIEKIEKKIELKN